MSARPRAELLGRREFAGRVGITESTVSRWVQEGVVRPDRVKKGRYWVLMFSERDVHNARAVRATQRRFKGQLTLVQALAIVRGEKDPPDMPKAPQAALRPPRR